MAHTEVRGSRRFAQYAIEIPCSLCETLESVFWYCDDCRIYLCKVCKQAHARIPSCMDHAIISVRDGDKLSKISIICTEHQKSFQCYCKTCSKSICINCLTSIHRLHDFIGLAEHVRNVRENVVSKLRKKNTELENILHEMKHLVEYKTQYVQQMSERGAVVRKSAQEKRRELEEQEAKTLTDLDKEKNEKCEKLDAQQMTLQDMADNIRQLHGSMSKELAKETTDQEFLQFIAEEEPKLDSLITTAVIQLPNPPDFIPGMTSFAPSKTFGSLAFKRPKFIGIGQDIKGDVDKIPRDSRDLLKDKLRSDIKVVSKFKVKESIRNIVVLNDNKAWIGLESKALHLVDVSGKVEAKIKLTDIPLHTTVSENGCIFISTGTKIKCINKTRKVSDFSNLAPSRGISGIVHIKRNILFACVQTETGKFKTVKIDTLGNIISEINSEIFANSRVLRPLRVSDDSICIMDDLNNMVFLDNSGSFTSCVERTGILRDVDNLAFDGEDYIIAGHNDSVMIMDINGVCLQTYRILDCGGRVEIIAVSDDHCIWVGTDNGKVLVLQFLR